MKRVLLAVAFFSLSVSAQDYLPEGWDEIFMDGKPAYMNINTGEVSRSYPKGVARQKVQNNTSYYTTINNNIGADTHTVQRGETLSKIARKYNTSLRNLYKANPSIDFNNLAVGQRINVDKTSNSANVHIVRTGETLFRIAKNNGLSVSELKSLNSLSSNQIRIGQRLRIR